MFGVGFTATEMRSMLDARPFVPFRLRLTSRTHVDVLNPKLALTGKTVLFVGKPDPGDPEGVFGGWSMIDYAHVVSLETLPDEAADTPAVVAPR